MARATIVATFQLPVRASHRGAARFSVACSQAEMSRQVAEPNPSNLCARRLRVRNILQLKKQVLERSGQHAQRSAERENVP